MLKDTFKSMDYSHKKTIWKPSRLQRAQIRKALRLNSRFYSKERVIRLLPILLLVGFVILLGFAGRADFTACQLGGQC